MYCKAFFKEKVSRGKIEVFVTIAEENTSSVEIEIDRNFADGYVTALKSISEIYDVPNDITASIIARNSDVFGQRE